MEYQVILSGGFPARRYGEPNTDYFLYNLEYFDVALRSAGLHAPIRVDSGLLEGRSFADAAQELATRIIDRLDARKMNIVGLSNWSMRSMLSHYLARILRCYTAQQGIPLILIGGGPHFAREAVFCRGEALPDPIDDALLRSAPEVGRPVYDGVVLGGMGAFVELVRSVANDRIAHRQDVHVPLDPLNGYFRWDREQMEVVGQGRSCEPLMNVAPIAVVDIPGQGGSALVAIFSNGCPHQCDYCAIPRCIHFTEEQVLGGARRAVETYGIDRLRNSFRFTLWDPNPFAPANRARTMASLEAIWTEIGKRIPVELCCPSSQLEHPEELARDLEALQVVKLTIARDAIGEPGVSFMQPRNTGTVVSTAQLAREKDGLEELVRRLGSQNRRSILELSYIVSPIETPTSLLRMFDEMESLAALGGDSLQVDADWSFLFPFPGTALRSRHAALISDKVYDALGGADAWDANALRENYPEASLQALRDLFGLSPNGGVYDSQLHTQIRKLTQWPRV